MKLALAGRLIAVTVAIALLSSCGRQTNDVNQPAVAIEKGDVCTVCGMYIEGQPGPRAEAYVDGVSKALKFGGTRDFFAFVTQPDEIHRLRLLYVQDTARIDWNHPSDSPSTFTDARKAYYVAWQPLAGEMGPTFASFARKSDAELFVNQHGGAILHFGQITADLVSGLADHCPTAASSFHVLAASCIAAKR